MDIGKKAIIGGTGLLLIGGLSVYLLMAAEPNAGNGKPANRHQGAMRAAIAQIEHKEPATESAAETILAPTPDNNSAESSATPEMTHAAFLAQAELRREQQKIDLAEAERLEKLRKHKKNSPECKFWKQQQQTSSTAAKIIANIEEHCMIAQDLANANAASSAASSAQATL